MPRIELICITLREDLIEIQKSYGYSGTQSGAGKLGVFRWLAFGDTPLPLFVLPGFHTKMGICNIVADRYNKSFINP